MGKKPNADTIVRCLWIYLQICSDAIEFSLLAALFAGKHRMGRDEVGGIEDRCGSMIQCSQGWKNCRDYI